MNVLKDAPWSVVTIIAATMVATIFGVQWVYSARFDALNEQLRLKDAQLAAYSHQGPTMPGRASDVSVVP